MDELTNQPIKCISRRRIIIDKLSFDKVKDTSFVIMGLDDLSPEEVSDLVGILLDINAQTMLNRSLIVNDLKLCPIER